MGDDKFLRYARLLLKTIGRNTAHRRVYEDDVLLIEESMAGIRAVGWTIPRGRELLDWRRPGLFGLHDDRLPEEEAHLEKLIVLYALAALGE
jgi:hypothetical protein